VSTSFSRKKQLYESIKPAPLEIITPTWKKTCLWKTF